jgi:polysaccharide chain length determinant protein (PEP-CTERM system associated)
MFSDSLPRPIAAVERRRRLFVWTTIAMLGVAGAFAFGLPNVYRASASLLVQGQWVGTVVTGSVPGGIDGRLQTIKQEALSRARLSDLLQRFDLYGVSTGRTTDERALARLQRDIRVESTSTETTAGGGAQTLAFRVSYVSSDPVTAANVANAVAAFFVAHNDQLRVKQASHATEFLGAQLADTRKQLDAQEGRVRTFSTQNLGALPQQTEANIAAINRLDSQLRLNDAEQSKLVERRQSLKNDLAALQVQVPPETDASPQAQLTRLQKEVDDLRAKFGDNYPDVKAARARLEAFTRSTTSTPTGTSATPASAGAATGLSRKAVIEQALAEVDGQLQRIAAEDASLRSQISGYQRRVEEAPAQAPAFENLMRDYQATRDQFDSLQKRYLEAQLAERAESGDDTQEFRVLDAALPPTSAAGPSRIILFGLGALFAVLCGVGAAYAADRTDTSFHSVDDLRQFTRVPVLAIIPDIHHPVRWTTRFRHAALAGVGILVVAALSEGAFQLARSSDQVARLLSRVM